ncbi:hypothetical protein TNCV_5051391 [Trichonephila clavipes]|nr:hypothetical protein TNCV_5051391 [Trichonephila clavipes]
MIENICEKRKAMKPVLSAVPVLLCLPVQLFFQKLSISDRAGKWVDQGKLMQSVLSVPSASTVTDLNYYCLIISNTTTDYEVRRQ